MADDVFKHSTPELYDRYMVPLLFEPYAKIVAERVSRLAPNRVLETAAGTGVLTRLVAEAVPNARIVATDINPAVLDYLTQKVGGSQVTVQQANAQELPFEDESFDVVLCQFGVMFFPDKVQAGREALRVLRAGGTYLIVTFGRLDDNPVPRAADVAVAAVFPDDPPRYMERGPFSYADPNAIDADLREAGFTTVGLETVPLSTHVSARNAALGMVLGSPFRAEIERRDPAGIEQALDAVTKALAPFEGQNAPMAAHLVTATA